MPARNNKLSQSSDEISKAVNVFFEQKASLLKDLHPKNYFNHGINAGGNINFIIYQPKEGFTCTQV